MVDSGGRCRERQGRQDVRKIKRVHEDEHAESAGADPPHVGQEALVREGTQEDRKEHKDADRESAALKKCGRSDFAGVYRHFEDGVRVQCEEKEDARENEAGMVAVEIFAAEKDEEQEKQERPRSAHDRGSAIEDDERAPKAAERELRCERQQDVPARPRAAARNPRFDEVQPRYRDEAGERVPGEQELGLEEINALEEQVVGDEAGDHRRGRQVPLILLHPSKKLAPHTDSIRRKEGTKSAQPGTFY